MDGPLRGKDENPRLHPHSVLLALFTRSLFFMLLHVYIEEPLLNSQLTDEHLVIL